MQTIWKYPIPAEDSFTLELPDMAQPLCVQTQQGTPYLWVLLDSTYRTRPWQFYVLNTGQPVGERRLGRYLGTFQLEAGTLVFHCFVGV